MAKILAYGFPLDANFGGPSVVHGLRAALTSLYPGHELVVYQQRKVDPVSVLDLDFPVREFPYRKRLFKFYRDGLLLKFFGRRSRGASSARFWDDFRAADAVVNVYAICFCSSIRTYMSTTSRLHALRILFQAFGIGLMARLWGKLSVKSTSSFGPIEKGSDAFRARLACRWAFTRIVAREEAGRRELEVRAKVGRRIEVAPDLANAWRPARPPVARPRIGVAVSFQSEIQWQKLGLDYMRFMRELVAHAAGKDGCEVLLLPNQTVRMGGRTDVAVAEELRASLPGLPGITVFDAISSSPTALREAIASCSAVVSCRYHTCVAAFASGVPTLVLGWHCKYEELVKRYGQERWMLSTEACASMDVKKEFDELWNRRSSIAAELAARGPDVVAAAVDSVAYLFGRDFGLDKQERMKK